MKTLVILSLFIIVSCAPGPQEYPEATIRTELGIAVGSIDARQLNLAEIDTYYQIVSNCVANKVIPPDFTIITQSDPIVINGREVHGATWHYKDRPPVVRIYYPEWRQEGVALSILSHEMVHVVLEYIGEPLSDNINHLSPLFNCSI